MSKSLKAFLTIASLFLLVFIFFYGLGEALTPLVIAFVFSYLLFPLIKKIESTGISRNFAALLILAIALIFTVSSLFLIIPKLSKDITYVAKNLPENLFSTFERIELWLAQADIDVDFDKESIKDYLQQNIDEISKNLVAGVTKSAKGVLSSAIKLILIALNILLIPLFFYYVTVDYEHITKSLKSLIPDSFLPKVDKYLAKTNTVLSGFIRGQLTVAATLGFIYAICLWLIGLKFGFVIGFFAGIACLIPYAGPAIGLTTAIATALGTGMEINSILAILAVFAIAQVLEGTLITPKLVGDRVGLSELSTVLALIVGGNLFGFVGMLIAIPLAAVTKSIFSELREEYKNIQRT